MTRAWRLIAFLIFLSFGLVYGTSPKPDRKPRPGSCRAARLSHRAPVDCFCVCGHPHHAEGRSG